MVGGDRMHIESNTNFIFQYGYNVNWGGVFTHGYFIYKMICFLTTMWNACIRDEQFKSCE